MQQQTGWHAAGLVAPTNARNKCNFYPHVRRVGAHKVVVPLLRPYVIHAVHVLLILMGHTVVIEVLDIAQQPALQAGRKE